MRCGVFSGLLLFVLGLAALATPHRASAGEAHGANCHAYSDVAMPMDAAIRTLDWRCDGSGWEDGQVVTWLLFGRQRYHETPEVFASRMTVFDSVTIAAIGNNSILAERRSGPKDAKAVPLGPVFTVPLPDTAQEADHYLVRIVKAHSVTVGTESSLWSSPMGEEDMLIATVILAVIGGMLIMPLLFDGMFFIVLRERFVLFHAGMTMAMITYALTAGGLLSAFVDVPIDIVARISPVAWAIGVGCGGLFVREFIEEGGLPEWMRTLLLVTAAWVMLVAGFAGMQFDFSQGFDNQLYFYAFIPVIPVYVSAIITGLSRGSKSARFLAVAWLPVIAASLDRLFRGIGLYADTDSADLTLFVALGFEVIIVALGIADRFLQVRRERDHALTEARLLEELTERDALTGLLNRRALEERFDILRAEGFTTIAVIDLDHFKVINDQYGHIVGDVVLKCAASALRRNDEDSLVFRLGGEEFVMLMRGQRTLARAEERRKAIADEVRDHCPISHRVTASMGVVEAPRDALADATFEALYNRADRLLYEAKAGGRDRTISERLKVFRQRQADRRAAA